MSAALVPELVPDLMFVPDVITAAEEAALLTAFAPLPVATAPYDPGNDRASLSYGWKYDHAADTFRPCPPIPEFLMPLCAAVSAATGVSTPRFAEALLNRYGPGAIIQPHFDKPLWNHVIGVSLAADTVMHFDRPDDPARIIAVPLPRRSLYVLQGAALRQWRHALPPGIGTRWSVTLRTFNAAGERLRAESERAASDCVIAD